MNLIEKVFGTHSERELKIFKFNLNSMNYISVLITRSVLLFESKQALL